MALWGDFHTHSTYSHGKGSVEEIVQKAYELGLKEIGISDHGILNYPNNMSPKEVDSFVKDVKLARIKYPNINVYAGIEANLISHNGIMDLNEELEEKLDYVICGYHSVRAMKVSPRKLASMFIPNFITKNNAKLVAKNTEAYIKAMDKYRISIIAHPLKGIKCDLRAIAECAKEKNVHIEINNKNMVLAKEHFEILADVGVKLIISSDAHSIDNIGVIDVALSNSQNAGLENNIFQNWDKLPNLNFNPKTIIKR